jgi:hypothetical protein
MTIPRGHAAPEDEEEFSERQDVSIKRLVNWAERKGCACQLITNLETEHRDGAGSDKIQYRETISESPTERTEQTMHKIIGERLKMRSARGTLSIGMPETKRDS